MTTGDEPHLGGESHDDSPMIGQRGAPILVSARGAYLAHNLEALVSLMDSPQRRQFRFAAVRHALMFVAPMIEAHPESLQRPSGLADTFQALCHTLQEPNKENIERLIMHLERHRENNFSREYIPFGADAVFDLLDAIVGLGSDYVDKNCAIRAINTAQEIMNPQFNLAYATETQDLVQQWYLDSAWSILQGRDMLPPPDLDNDTLHARLSDADTMYREGRLIPLLYLMNTEQRQRFKRILREEAFHSLEHYTTAHPSSDEVQTIVNTIRGWMAQPDGPPDEAVTRLHDQYRSSSHPGSDWDFDRMMSDLLNCFSADGHRDQVKSAYATVIFAGSITLEADPSTNDDEKEAQLTRWNLELAWAILHDQPLPLLK
jgi:hypothetical protein